MRCWTPGQNYFRRCFSGYIQFPDCVFSPGVSPLDTYSAHFVLLLLPNPPASSPPPTFHLTYAMTLTSAPGVA